MTPTDTKSTVLLEHHLKALKLPTVAAECEPVARRCAAGNVDHLGFPLRVCERGLIERERKAADRRLKAARLPAEKPLAEFDFAARPSVNKPLVLDLVRGDYLGRRENVLFVGPSGTGKTHLATALAMAACGQGKRVRFWRVTELITTLREADQDRHLLRLRHQLGKLDLPALDEFGDVPASPVHDAVLIEAAEADIDGAVEAMQGHMKRASEIVLAGFPLRTDVKVVKHPDRYSDKRGVAMWQAVCELCGRSP